MNSLVQNILNLTHRPVEQLPDAINLKPVSISQPNSDGGGTSSSSNSDIPVATTEKKPLFRTCGCQD